MMMKRFFLYMIFAAPIILTGCTRNFSDINTDPTKISPENFNPNDLLAAGELGYANITEHQLYEFSCMTQIMASTMIQYGAGDKYDNQITAYNSRFFLDGENYASQLLAARTLAMQKDPDQYNNLIQMSIILWVLQMQRITDIYGDIPYSQAGMASQGITNPPYDKQSAIYPDMLSRLEDAINKLDSDKPLPTGDMIYGGNIDKWKKLGYSIMLRVAMRLTKADPETAKKYTEEAAGKTFTGIADNALIQLDGGPDALTINETANDLLTTNDFQELRWSKTFIDYLKQNNDPRLYVLTEKPDTGLAFNNDITHPGISYTLLNETPQGMPNGYDLSGATGIANAPDYPGPTGTGTNASPLGNYARPVLSVFASKSLPVYLVTYAQTELLLAEAAARGWNVGGTALQHYKNGVQAALQSLTQWSASLTIPDDSITNFVNHLTLGNTQDSMLNVINSQYWAACIFDFPEAWNNWKRSGYPVLTPVHYVNNITSGTIPRRMPYPASENQANPANYVVAIQRMGGTDLPTTRVWWDKP